MKTILTATVLTGVFAVTPAWALFETNKQLIRDSKIPLDEAVKYAVKAVPGQAVEADLGKEEGRTVWKIEIIDTMNKTQTVYVDAQTGQARRDK